MRASRPERYPRVRMGSLLHSRQISGAWSFLAESGHLDSEQIAA